MSNFHLEILAPGRKFYSGDVESVIVPGVEGEYGILADHLPVIIALKDGVLKIKEGSQFREAIVHKGFAQIEHKSVLIMSDAIEWPEEIDVNRAIAAKERAEERLRQQLSQQEYIRSKSALARAMARLRITREIR